MTDETRESESYDVSQDDAATPQDDAAGRAAAGVTRSARKGSRAPTILAVTLLGGVAIMVLLNVTGGTEVLRSRMARAPSSIDGTAAGEQLASSPRYRETLYSANQIGAANASETASRSFLATVDEPVEPLDIDEPVETVEVTPPKLPPANESPQVEIRERIVYRDRIVPQAQPTADWESIERLAQRMASQQGGLANAWTVGPSKNTVIIEQELFRSPDGHPVGVQVGTAPPAQAAAGSVESTYQADLTTSLPYLASPRLESEPSLPVSVGRRLDNDQQPFTEDFYASAGEITFAVVINGSDTDTPGPVVAKIVRGPLKGARLIGSFSENHETTAMVVQFDRVVLRDGTNLEAEAYAIDAKDGTLAVRSDYDSRMLQRYGPKLAGAFLEGLGSTLAQTRTTIVPFGFGGAGIERREPNMEEALYAGVGEVGGELAEEIEDLGPEGPIVRLSAGKLIGVLFTENVGRF